MDWYVSRTFAGKNLADPQEKQKIVDILLPEVGRIPYAVERDHWLQQLAARVGVDVSVLREDMKRVAKHQVPGPSIQSPREETPQNPTPPKRKSRADDLFERVLMYVLLSKEGEILTKIQAERFPQIKGLSSYPLYEKLFLQYTSQRSIEPDKIRTFFETQDSENIVDVLIMKAGLEIGDLDTRALSQEASDTLSGLHELLRKEAVKTLELELRQAEAEKDQEKMQKILKQVQVLNTGL